MGDEEIKIDAEKFHKRLDKLVEHWQSQRSSLWGDADALCIALGAREQEGSYSKSQALHLYLFGMECLTDTLILLSKNEFVFISDAKPCTILKEQLDSAKKKSARIRSFCFLEKTEDEGRVREIFDHLQRRGMTLGTLLKGQFEGNFAPIWKELVSRSKLKTVDVSDALGLFLASKDEQELEFCRRTAVLTSRVIEYSFVESMESIILEGEEQASHRQLFESIKDAIFNPMMIGIEVSPGAVDLCYEPIVQSGGDYGIRLSPVSNEKNIAGNIVLCSLGARYKSYCAHISRTYLMDPPAKVEKTYQILVELFQQCLERMVSGNELKDVYESAKEFLKKENADLLQYLPETLGFALGIEFCDSSLLLNQTNNHKFAPGIVFSLSWWISPTCRWTARRPRASSRR